MDANPLTRFIKWFLIFVIMLVIVISGLVSWIYYSDAGLKWSLTRVQNFLPKELSIQNIEGNLSDKLIIHNSLWQQDDLNIQVDNLSLNCQWIDLLFNQLNCETVEIGHLIINISEQPGLTEPEEDPTGLPEFSLPFRIKFKALLLDKLMVNNYSNEQVLLTETLFNQIQLNSLNYSLSTFVWNQLTFELNQHQFKSSGNFNPDNKWLHQIKLTTTGPDFSFELLSKGKINQQANFELATTYPFELESSGLWLWHNGLLVNQAKINADKQTIQWQEQTIELAFLQSQIEIVWPLVTSNSQFKASWQQFDQIEIQAKTRTTDVNNWQFFSTADVQIKGMLTDKIINQSLKELGTLPAKNISNQINWPINISLATSIEEDKVKLATTELQIGELKGTVNGEMTLFKDSFNFLSLTTAIQADALEALLGYPVNDLELISKTIFQNDHWTVESKGSASSITHPEISLNRLNWDIYLNEKWSGNLQAQSVSLQAITFLAPTLTIKGNEANHHIKLVSRSSLSNVNADGKGQSISIPHSPMTLELDGRLTQKQAKYSWQISELAGNFSYDNFQFELNAKDIELSAHKQKMGMGCVSSFALAEINNREQSDSKNNQLGALCLSAEYFNQKGLVNFDIKNLDLASIFHSTKKHFDTPLTDIKGVVNGHGKIAASLNHLIHLELDFTLPELITSSAESELAWQNISLRSSTKTPDFEVILGWQNQLSKVKAANWQSEMIAPAGQVSFIVSPKMDINFHLDQQQINWQLPHSVNDNQPVSLPFPKVEIIGQLSKNKLNAQLSVHLLENDHLLANLGAEWPVTPKTKISGDWELLISQLDWLKKWQNNIDHIDLKLQQKATFSGTLEKPLIKGQGELSINQFTIEEIGLDIKQSYVNLINENQNLSIDGNLKNQAGELALTGNATLYPQLSADLNLHGNSLTLIDNPENQVVVSPTISANYAENFLKVDGKIIFDKASIKINALPQQAISVSVDQKIIGQTAIEKSPFRYRVKLDLETGEDVKFDGFGLVSDINGRLKTTLQNTKPATLNGRLNLKNGTFEAYKQKLTIEEGQLLFIGPIDNPGIQFRATRVIDKIKVGIIGDGSLSNPRLTLYSNPVMPEENILALLLTGRSIESLTQSEGNALANAAIGLGVEGANKLAQKIGAVLGIKNMSITSKTKADSTRVDIAAQISDSLNVGYGTSIDSKNEMLAGWIIEYQISPGISFEAVSGEEVSASINFKKQIASLSEEDKKD